MPRQVYLFDEVNKLNAEIVVRELLYFNRISDEEITLFINSPGGVVSDMFSIIDTMNIIESPVRTIVMGDAASCAAIIAACGKTRLMTENSRIMLHEIWTIMLGSVSDMDDNLKNMKKEQDKILNLLSKKTGKTADQIKNIIEKSNKYFNAKESKNFGLIDEIIQKDSAQVIKLSESLNAEGYEIDINEEGLSKVQVLKAGEYNHPSYGVLNLTEETLNKFVTNFKNNVRGIDLSIDYTHDNDGGEKPAACWIKDLSVENTDKGVGLFASVEFTPKGKKLVEEKEYKYASADFAINYNTDKDECVPYVLLGGTLTNRPFIKEMNPIKLSESNLKENKNMTLEAITAELKNSHGIDIADLQSSNKEMRTEIDTLKSKIKELNALPMQKEEELKNLKEQINILEKGIEVNNKEKVFNSLMEAGKVVPAQKDAIMNKFDTAAEIEEFYTDSPVIVNLNKNGADENAPSGLTQAEQDIVSKGIYTAEEVVKYRSIEKK